MARAPRIEFPNAWYHIMNRGAGRRTIFPTDELKQKFLEFLSDIHSEYEIAVRSQIILRIKLRHCERDIELVRLF